MRTFRELRLYRQLLIFIVAFWIYNDGIGTIIKMATIYGAEIGIGQIDLIGALLLTQFVGIPFSLLFGRLPRHGRSAPGVLPELWCSTTRSPSRSSASWRPGWASPAARWRWASSWPTRSRPSCFSLVRAAGISCAGLARRLNTKNAILLALGVYTLVSIWGFFMAHRRRSSGCWP